MLFTEYDQELNENYVEKSFKSNYFRCQLPDIFGQNNNVNIDYGFSGMFDDATSTPKKLPIQ